MSREAILQAAATLLASSRNASYTPEMAARDARRMAEELRALESREIAEQLTRFHAAQGTNDEEDDGA